MSAEGIQRHIEQLNETIRKQAATMDALQDQLRRHKLAAQGAQRGIERRNRKLFLWRRRIDEAEHLLRQVYDLLDTSSSMPSANEWAMRSGPLRDRIARALRLVPPPAPAVDGQPITGSVPAMGDLGEMG